MKGKNMGEAKNAYGKKAMSGIVLAAIILVGAIIILLLASIGIYNGLVGSDENVDSKWANVQSAYQRRADLIPNLVSTVEGARDFEQETLVKITEMRSQAGQAKIDISQASSPEELESAMGSMNGVLSRLLVIVEQYPQLKTTENFLSLQDELSGTENRIKVERDAYNEAVKDYNVKVRRFPSNIIAGMYGFEQRDMFSSSPGSENAPSVEF